MFGNKKEIWDYLDLFFLHLSKLNRKRMVEQSDDEFYNSFFTDTDANTFYSGIDLRRTIKQNIIRETVLENIPIEGKILDVGCGIGDNLAPFIEDNIEAVGIEYSKSSFEIARNILPDKIKLYHGSATKLPFNSSTFDGIICIEVLEHIDDHWQALREINRVTKLNGFIIISVPYRHWFTSYLKLMGHFRHYTRDMLNTILGDMGFRVIKYLPNYPHWHRFANYFYIMTRILTFIPKLFGKNIFPHQLNWPFTSKSMLTSFYSLIDKFYRKDSKLDYNSRQSSTFILARKIDDNTA